MNSRSGGRGPAGVSDVAGRGIVGTVAPTAPDRSDARAVAVLSPVLWAVAIGYAAAGVTLVHVACVLAPWGLLLLILAIGALAAAVLCGFVAFGISRLEEDPA